MRVFHKFTVYLLIMKRVTLSQYTFLTPKTLALGLGLILGGFIRCAPVLSAAFPIKDGGLFFAFIDQLQQNHFSLANTISYNGLTIPFAYPPLSFYLSAIISSLTNLSPIIIIKILPALFSILTIAAFYLLASTILETERQVCFAVISFALLPTAVDFMIVGGGLPRSMGYLFAILALQQIWLLFTHANRRHLVWSILWVGLTFLCHPVVTKFLVYSIVITFLYKDRTMKGVYRLLVVAIGVLIWTSPWWLLVVSHHGISPFINALRAAPQPWISYLAAFLFMQTNEPYLHIQGLLALIGLFVCLNVHKYWLPVWLGVVFILEPRLVASYSIIPTALLVSIGLDFLLFSFSALISTNRLSPSPTSSSHPSTKSITPIAKIMVGFLLIYAILSAFIATPRQSLSHGDREAMAWIKNNLPAGSPFLVISGITGAGEDYVAEWFPILTGSVSLSTPQGMEWLPGGRFTQLWQSHDSLEACLSKDTACLEAWGKDNAVQYHYVYLDKSSGKYEMLFTSLKITNYHNVFENSNVAIFSRFP